jgi:2-oxoglutarate ferredoxin oxidoreductase subunit gamma
VISEERIVYPLVIKADILIAMSQSAYELYIEDVKVQGGIVIYDAQLVTPRDVVGLKQIGIPATSKVIEEFDNKQIANMAMLGATVKLTGVVSSSALVAAVETNVESTYRVLNLKAVESGLKLGEMANKNGSRR